MRDLTFSEVCKFIKEDDLTLIDTVDSLLTLALLLSPLAFGLSIAALEPALGLLTLKNELIKQGKKLFDKLTAKNDSDVVLKQQRMLTAYGLICYTSYFDALDRQLPEVKRILGLTPGDRFMLSTTATERLEKQADSCTGTDQPQKAGPCDIRLPIPHPAETFDRAVARLRPLHTDLTKGVISLLEAFAAWESSSEDKRKEIVELLRKLPEKAAARFEAQYFALCVKHHDFYTWANLQEHSSTRVKLDRLSGDFQTFAAHVTAYRDRIDLGFSELSQLISAIPANIDARHAAIVFTELERNYLASIEEPIIKDPSTGDSLKPSLAYPKKSDIFVPQSFKALRYTPGHPLEDEATWDSTPIRKDLGQFLLAYLSSPYSTTCPLIILGQPGCGKSLLSHMLAARFVSNAYTPIRVELRSIDADNELEVQIEEQIRKDTGRYTSFATLTEHLNNRPALIIFDGYDELLQASGQVFASYIMKVQKFQEREAKVLRRNPLRAVVTSRLTLINKALVPADSTIIRLIEFDAAQQQKWISVWNHTNQSYFEETGTSPFQLPSSNERVKPLAEQPLLLLMLALYDSVANQLRTKRGLDQTLLYESLLKQFIEREHLKSPEFRTLSPSDQKSTIDLDLERLGAAAIGMFNRRSLHIRTTQLDADLAFLKLERAVPPGQGRTLSQAELLLGSFFFMHKSKSEHKGEHALERESDVAFEFLHNTFGEFLAGDFIIRRLLRETTKLGKLRQDSDLRIHRERVIDDADGLPEDWFASLMYAPFFLRPVILEMMREWFRHRMTALGKTVKECLADFEDIVRSHVKRFLLDRAFPTVMIQKGKTSFGDLPLLGYVAIYTLNLVTLAAVLSPEDFVLDEQGGVSPEERAGTWDRLCHLWQAWFAPDTLNSLVAIFTATREERRVILKARESFRTTPVHERLDTVINVGLALGDDVSVSLAGLARNDVFREAPIEPTELQRRSDSVGLNLDVQILLKRIREFSWRPRRHEERRELLGDCTKAIDGIEVSKLGILIDLLRGLKAMGEYGMFVELADAFVRRLHGVELRGPYGVQVFLAIFRLGREWPLWGLPFRMVDQLLSMSDFDLVMNIPNADFALEWARFGPRTSDSFPRERLERLVGLFEDAAYLESASPEIVVEFLKSGAYRRPPLDRIAQLLMGHFLLPHRLFSISPDAASDLLSIGRKTKFIEFSKNFCDGLERRESRSQEDRPPSFRTRWERYHGEGLDILGPAGWSLRLWHELLQTILHYGSQTLQAGVLREALSRPFPADTAIGLDVIRLARRLGRETQLIEAIRDLQRRFHVAPEETASRGPSSVFMRGFHFEVGAVPISGLGDLRWFAELCQDEKLVAQIQKIVASVEPEQSTLFGGDE